MSAAEIPQRLDELTAEWLNRSVGAAVLGPSPVERVEWEPLGEGEGFVGQLGRLRVASADGASRCLIAKLPTHVPENRTAGELLGAYEREICFYRELAPRVAYRTPRFYHAEMDDNPASKYGPPIIRFIDRLPVWAIRLLMGFFRWVAARSTRRYLLLIEDLAPARLGDQVAGRTPDDCPNVMVAIANAQAPFWGGAGLGEHFWVARMDIGARIMHQTFRESQPIFLDRFSAHLQDADRDMLAWLDRNAVALLTGFSAEAPPTLVHGDFRLDNLFFDDGDEPVVIDWQGVCCGPGVYDVAYFLSGTLAPETPEPAVLELVRIYHEALEARGVKGYDLATCVRDYRRSMLVILHRLVTIDAIDLGEERGVAMIDLWIERVLARTREIDSDTLLTPSLPERV